MAVPVTFAKSWRKLKVEVNPFQETDVIYRYQQPANHLLVASVGQSSFQMLLVSKDHDIPTQG